MSIEANKALVRRLVDDVVNAEALGLVEELFAADFAANGRALGVEDVKGAIARHHREFPGYRITVEEMVAEGDAVVIRAVVSGTHAGEARIGGIRVPATGKPATWRGFVLFRIAGGKIAEEWAVTDNLGLLQQLGVTPHPGAGQQ
jgi:predicted ester cyclase